MKLLNLIQSVERQENDAPTHPTGHPGAPRPQSRMLQSRDMCFAIQNQEDDKPQRGFGS